MADYGVSANRLELLQIADAVAREKSIDKSVVLHAMEEAIQKAAKARYGAENEIVAEIDPRSGETRLQRLLLVGAPAGGRRQRGPRARGQGGVGLALGPRPHAAVDRR